MRKLIKIILVVLLIALFFLGCSLLLEPIVLPTEKVVELPQPQVVFDRYTLTPSATSTTEPTRTPTPNLEISATPSLSPTITPTPTMTLSPTPTVDPYLDLYMESLAQRTYGGGLIQDAGNLNSAGVFTRKLFKYRSEGLNMYGFINIPRGEGPFPVIVMLHGYVEPEKYTTLDYSTRYADALAEDGYIVIHPNLRGYAPSPAAENALGIGDTVDVLNLISLLRSQAGTAGFLQEADADRIGLWGHSMGGGIVLRILAIDQEIDAALIYASVNADEELNLAHFDGDGRGNMGVSFPIGVLEMISPMNYLENIEVPVSIYHGAADTVVPVEWSVDLCEKMKEMQINTVCTYYEDQEHTFQNSGDTVFIASTADFYNTYLKGID